MASKEKTNNDIKKIIDWAETMRKRSQYPSSTVSNRIKALKDITSVLAEDEPKDTKSILDGLDDIVHRWAIKIKPTSGTAQSKKSHAKGLLLDYLEFLKNPTGFKPGRRGRRPKKEVTKPKAPKAEKKKIGKKPEVGDEEGAELQPPTLNINIQIHISAETSEKQIDKIFESMAKYIPFKKT